jgi:glycine/D-amino acid oxidase-like deaminating enzyme
LTTLAIIGSGIAGRSLIYTLAKEKKSFKKIVIFSSETFLKACSYRSTAVVAKRGLTRGHSPLGDSLLEGFELFETHFKEDAPLGIGLARQVSASTQKLDEFKKRYPEGGNSSEFTHEEVYQQTETAYLVDPSVYLTYLLESARAFYQDKLQEIDDLVVEVFDSGEVRAVNGEKILFDKVIFATGAYTHFWTGKGKTSQGSYLEFSLPDFDFPSLSLTYNSHNYVWNNLNKKLLLGSTTLEVLHEIHPQKALQDIYQSFKKDLKLPVPQLSEACVRVGLREKASKRSPYIFNKGKIIYMGGMYKNGYTLGLSQSRRLVHQFF